MNTGQYQEGFLAAGLMLLAGGIILAAKLFPLPAAPLIVVSVLTMGLSVFSTLRESRFTWLPLGMFIFSLGLLSYTVNFSLPGNDISRWAGEELQVTGVIYEEPYYRRTSQGNWRLRYGVEAREIKDSVGETVKVQGRLYVYAGAENEAEIPAAKIGDSLRVKGKLRLPHSYGNPGQIDTTLLLREQGITARLTAGKTGVVISPGEEFPFGRKIGAIREHYLTAMQEVMPKTDAAAIFATLFGGYGGLKPELLEAFTVTGIVHILSVSGSHISLLAAVTASLANLLKLPKAAGTALVIGLIFIYSALSAFVPPVIRSAIMGGLAFTATLWGEERSAGRILWLTGIFMLIIDPLLLFHISWQLSFAATFGLLYLSPIFQRWLIKLPRPMAVGLAVTLAAHLATVPIIAWYFQQLSLSSFLANLIAVPIVEVIIVLGLAAGLVSVFIPLLGKIIFMLAGLLLGIVYELTRAMARLPLAQVYIPAMNLPLTLLYSVALGVLLLPATWREWLGDCLKKYRREILLSLAVVGVSLGLWQRFRPPELAVHFIDVGQGDAALVVTPHGRAMLFDTGGSRDPDFSVGERVVAPYLRHYGVTELDFIFLSHAHEDHAAGAGDVIKKIPARRIFTAAEGREAYRQSMRLNSYAPELKLLTEAQEGASFILDGVKVEILFAPSSAIGSSKTGNEVSNVYRVSYGKASFLFTGDLVKESEAALLARNIPVASTVLKVGHHGSDTSTSEEFLASVAPKFGVFCVGKNNGFGHPKKTVLEKFAAANIKTYRTDEDGAVVFYTDGEKIRSETFR